MPIATPRRPVGQRQHAQLVGLFGLQTTAWLEARRLAAVEPVVDQRLDQLGVGLL